LVYLLSAVWRIYFSSGFSFLFVVVGLILVFLGIKHLKVLWFPIAFLIFMLPLPMVVIANISFRLKIFASQVSTAFINMLGVPAVREGSVIKTLHSYVVVEDPCSGIRSLIALIALGALMAYFSRLSRPKKIILFLASIPLAVITNIIRIIAVTLASEMYGAKFATGAFHDAMGIMVFVLAFLGLLFVANLLE
jgi:exosortase